MMPHGVGDLETNIGNNALSVLFCPTASPDKKI